MSEPSHEGRSDWNANLYDAKHAFVWKFGADLLPLLAPKSGERILDIGCGTGHLTAQIAESGAQVVGIDRSLEMASAARTAYPNLQFEVADARKLPYQAEFDAVFSVWNAVRPGGRFVAEFGGKGNIAKMKSAFDKSLAELHSEPEGGTNPWYYPSVREYATLLENHGFEVRFMTLFDRPTPLADGEAGLRNWMTMFASDYYAKLSPESREVFLQSVEDRLRPGLFRDGQWWADYRRLRFAAWK